MIKQYICNDPGFCPVFCGCDVFPAVQHVRRDSIFRLPECKLFQYILSMLPLFLDDLFFSEYMEPPLITMRTEKYQWGKQLMHYLLSLFAQEGSEENLVVSGETLLEPVSLVIRSSTAPPPDKNSIFQKNRKCPQLGTFPVFSAI